MAERHNATWRKDEEAFLREHYYSLDISELAAILGRTYKATAQKAKRMNVKSSRQPKIGQHYRGRKPLIFTKRPKNMECELTKIEERIEALRSESGQLLQWMKETNLGPSTDLWQLKRKAYADKQDELNKLEVDKQVIIKLQKIQNGRKHR